LKRGISQEIILPDKRKLGYSIWGNIEAKPFLFFHGFPGSRLEGLLFRKSLKMNGFFLISIDRPGIGNSSPKEGRTLADWAQDILFLLKKLQIHNIHIAGKSGGTPYALACAKYLPKNLISQIFLISGMGPPEFHRRGLIFITRFGLKLAKQYPNLNYKVFSWLVSPVFSTIKRTIVVCKIYKCFSPNSDKECITNTLDNDIFYENIFYAFKQGSIGVSQDVEIFANSWGFKLSEINTSIPITILHGKQDRVIRWQMAELLYSKLSNSTIHLFPKEGHFSTTYNHLSQFLN
jgi:pimeloyl-ACP methyl ester carboxylesterase